MARTTHIDKRPRRYRNQRRRVPRNFPPPPAAIEVPWAKARAELRNYGPAQAAIDLMALPEWESELAGPLREIDFKNPRRASKIVFATHEMELLRWCQFAYGLKTFEGRSTAEKGLLTHLRHPDQRQDLQLLGFDKPRDLPERVLPLRRADEHGLPSGARMSQHLERTRGRTRDLVAAWRNLYEKVRATELSLAATDELDVLYLDSSNVETIFTCAIKDAKTGEVVNPHAVTCSGGGRLPKDSHDPHAEGFKLTLLWSKAGMPLGFAAGAITDHDTVLAPKLLEEVGPLLAPRIVDHPTIGVIVCDAGFHTPYALRKQIRSFGYLESCAETSAANAETAQAEDNRWYPFKKNPHWGTNGHRELNCECGDASVTKRARRLADGSLSVWLEAKCPKGETFTVTSGSYLLKGNPRMWDEYDPTYVMKDGTPEREMCDLRLGNGLTFNDWMHVEYAQKRFAHNEGIHGALTRSELLFHGKNRFRSLDDLLIATYQVLIYLHLRGIEFRTRRADASALAA